MIQEMIARGLADIDCVISTDTFKVLNGIDVEIHIFDPTVGSPMHVWNRMQKMSKPLMLDRSLIFFQDQSWAAQAIASAAKQLGVYRILIQDGFLSHDEARAFGWRKILWPLTSRLDKLSSRPNPFVRTWLNAVLYRQHFFGFTRPDRILVFGEAMKERLNRQFKIPYKQICVTGPLLRPEQFRTDHKPLRSGEKLTVLFLDQCFLRYNRMSPKNWKLRYLPLVSSLSAHNLKIKLHPSQGADAASQVIHAAGPEALILGRDRISETSDIEADVAVTVSSTAFMACLAAGIPVIFCDCGALDRMPKIAHPLLANAKDFDGVQNLISRYLVTGQFPGSARGRKLSFHVKPEQPEKFTIFQN